jgi:hypothetical protein
MRPKKPKLTIIKKALILLFFIPITSFSQEDATWDYPIKPGSEEWLKIDNYSQRLEQLNIPIDIIEKISTEELVRICLNYPQIELVFTRNDLIEGITYVSTLFNGFIELANRKDAGIELLRQYEHFSPSNLKRLEKSEKIQSKKNFIIIELLLSSPIVLKNINKSERIKLLNTAYNMYEEKAKYWDKLYHEQISTNLLIMAQILNIDNPTLQTRDGIEKDWQKLIRTGYTDNPEFISTLINETVNCVK